MCYGSIDGTNLFAMPGDGNIVLDPIDWILYHCAIAGWILGQNPLEDREMLERVTEVSYRFE